MGSDSTLAERLDEVFGAALRERRVVGAVAVVARDGQVQYRRAHGCGLSAMSSSGSMIP